jgi:hypothetical protein
MPPSQLHALVFEMPSTNSPPPPPPILHRTSLQAIQHHTQSGVISLQEQSLLCTILETYTNLIMLFCCVTLPGYPAHFFVQTFPWWCQSLRWHAWDFSSYWQHHVFSSNVQKWAPAIFNP